MKKLQVLDFWAPWCGPCISMSDSIEDLMLEHNVDGSDVEIKKINVDQNPDVAQKYNIRSIPALIFLKDDKEVFKLVGLQSKSKISEKIEEMQIS